MTFEITRTSAGYEEDDFLPERVKPCKEARVKVIKISSTKTSMPMWTIEINTIHELIAFLERHGSLIIKRGDFLPEIEIYDSWRE